MRLAVFGGSFNPPHPGHVRAARAAYAALRPDRFVVMPAADPPHKTLPENSPPPEERLALTRLAFRDMPEAEVSELELRRRGESYTADTAAELLEAFPGAELVLVIGTDMLLSFETWHDFRALLNMAEIAALPRENGETPALDAYAVHLREAYGARVRLIDAPPLPMSSSELRAELVRRAGADTLDPEVYARIIRLRDYGARPQLSWLRERTASMLDPRRVPHVRGTEREAVRLAERWGADPGDAAEAAILHDITKKLDRAQQLILCRKYGIMVDTAETESEKLLHAVTGAAVARDEFGVPEAIYGAIRWHTTGRPAMTLLEKVIYLADYIEPTRHFEGVEPLRALAYEDIDSAMALGLDMCLNDLARSGTKPHGATAAARTYYGKET